MADKVAGKKTHKEWRKEVKKLRRKKIRQKLAEERNKKAAEEEASHLNDPEYQSWLREQEALEAAQLEHEEHLRREQEELWMRRELLAQKKFREQQRRQEATLAVKEAERLRIQKEFEELQQQAQKRREERKLREEQSKLEHEQMMQRIANYVEFGGTIPEELTSNVQSNPNREPCPFFSKTNACRFRMQCTRNHIRPKLGRILFFPNFFTHIKLEQGYSQCGSDIGLEYTENQLRNDYFEFFEDVVGELKKYGEIENFRTCMNTQPHLRGNVLVEYSSEREAMKAYMELQGRYYASRRINVEFSSIVTWKSAICGLSYTRKCPKGKDCNFLHIFKNPGNLYNLSVFKQDESMKKTSHNATRGNSAMSWNDGEDQSSKRNWRWSESPEPGPNGNKRSAETTSTKWKESSLGSSGNSVKKSRPDNTYNQSKSREESSSYRSEDSSSCRPERHRGSERKLRERSKSREKSSIYRSEDSYSCRSERHRSRERKVPEQSGSREKRSVSKSEDSSSCRSERHRAYRSEDLSSCRSKRHRGSERKMKERSNSREKKSTYRSEDTSSCRSERHRGSERKVPEQSECREKSSTSRSEDSSSCRPKRHRIRKRKVAEQSKSKERNSSYSPRNSSKCREEKSHTPLKTPESSQRHHGKGHRKTLHKDKKHKHKSKRSSS